MSEFDKLAKDIKSYSKKRGAKAVSAASASIGKIEKVKPNFVEKKVG